MHVPKTNIKHSFFMIFRDTALGDVNSMESSGTLGSRRAQHAYYRFLNFLKNIFIGSPVFSLGDCGLDRCPRLPNGRYSVYVELPSSYEQGDAIKLSASGGGGSKKEAKRDVVLKLLTMLLTIGPQKIHLPAGAFTFGQDAINNIREVAYLANDALFGQLSLVDTYDSALADLDSLRNLSVHARWRPEPRNDITARTSQTASALVNIMDESPGEGICRISGVVRMLVEFCRTARDGKFWPSRARLAQFQFLMTNVQPDTLRTIVEYNAHLFKVEEEITDVGRRWCIELQEHAQGPNCAANYVVVIPLSLTSLETSLSENSARRCSGADVAVQWGRRCSGADGVAPN